MPRLLQCPFALGFPDTPEHPDLMSRLLESIKRCLYLVTHEFKGKLHLNCDLKISLTNKAVFLHAMKIIYGFPKVSSQDVHQQSQQDICSSGQANPPGCLADDTHVQMDLPNSHSPRQNRCHKPQDPPSSVNCKKTEDTMSAKTQ